MISEFALDPALVAQWHDPKEWAFYREAFADGTGRFGSTSPRQNAKKWRQNVLRTFRLLAPDATADSRAWQRLDVLLERLSERMVERDSSKGCVARWLDSALAEHRVRPFHGILSIAPAEGVAEVITPEALFGDHLPSAWTVPPCPAVPRKPDGFAEALRPLLTRCREAVFVDPWFDPREPRFIEPLLAMLGVLWGPDRCVESPAAQLVIAEGEGRRKRDGAWLMELCRERLPSRLPQGRSLTFTVLRQRVRGEKIHNRYVLTKFAGVSFGTGLDVADREETEQTDDLCRLSREQLLTRWGQYVSGQGSHFDKAAGPSTISAQQ
jgi:hypothetical protein